jgi:hypothetical protein
MRLGFPGDPLPKNLAMMSVDCQHHELMHVPRSIATAGCVGSGAGDTLGHCGKQEEPVSPNDR